MSAHTIYDELCEVAKKLGVDVKDTHNIKDVIRRMNQHFGGDSNGVAIADAITRMKPTVPYKIEEESGGE